MAKGKLLGHINCPVCGTKDGMQINEDKNGQPFGYCEAECDAQLRIGGKPRRVEKFLALYPHLRREPDNPPANGGAVTVAPGEPDATATAKPAAPAPAPAPAPAAQPPKLPGLGFSLGGLAK